MFHYPLMKKVYQIIKSDTYMPIWHFIYILFLLYDIMSLYFDNEFYFVGIIAQLTMKI